MPPIIKKIVYPDPRTVVESSRTFQYSSFGRIDWNKVYNVYEQFRVDLCAIRKFRAKLGMRTEYAQFKDEPRDIWQQQMANLLRKVDECAKEMEELELELYGLE
ncbi:MAG: hypothetical protein Q9208_001410 [Pyrenodesmia sp. 3 TL-2023]